MPEFLLRVEEHVEGGFVATCRPVKTEPIADWFTLDHDGLQSEGQGATALAAMFAALVNGQVPVIGTRVSQ